MLTLFFEIYYEIVVDFMRYRGFKAPDGKYSSADGQDGKAGLPGYNGGSYVVYADYLAGRSNLTVISVEGKGGNGQDG